MTSPRVTDLQLQLRDAPTITLIAGARQERLAHAIDEFYAAIDAGQPVDRERLLDKYSDVADELDDCLRNLDFIQNVAPQLSTDATAQITDVASTIAQRTQLGDYKIIREIGRGGMGVVYEAEQMSLGRRVALKVLPFAAMLDKQQLARFKNEARAAATLKHPNIVSVYSIGCERSVHFFAMELVEGQSLAQVIEQLRTSHLPLRPGRRSAVVEEGRGEGLVGAASRAALPDNTVLSDSSPARLAGPTADTEPIAHLTTLPDFSSKEYYRSVAQLGIHAAEALDHAHQNGILHRDIKPANLLVDDTGKLWITDFGLARIDADAGMTMTGDILGTLRYMSPEQALAKRVVVDHRSDIYSLGVTLYELLTLKPAFYGDDRQELLRQIAFDEPRKPRQFNARMPRDLETIILKAIEKNPADRYSTAEHFADDLRLYLQGQPIKARPANLLQRMAKWSRRHVAAVWAASLVLLFVAIGLSAGTGFVAKARDDAITAQKSAERERARAANNLQLALTALDEVYSGMIGERLKDEPRLTEVRKDFLTRALKFYEQFAKENHAIETAWPETGRAYVLAAHIHSELGDEDKALEAYEKSLRIYGTLVNRSPDVPEYQFRLAQAMTGTGNLLFGMCMPKQAAQAFSDAIRLLENPPLSDSTVVPETADPTRYHLAMVYNFNNLAAALKDIGKVNDAKRAYRRVMSHNRQLAAKAGQTPDHHFRLAGILNNLALLNQSEGSFDDAYKHIVDAIEHHQIALDSNPANARYRRLHQNHYRVLCDVLMGRGDFEKAIDACRFAVDLAAGLVKDYPNVVGDYFALLRNQTELAAALAIAGRHADAEAEYRKCLSLFDDMPPTVSQFPSVGTNRATVEVCLAWLLRKTRPEESAALRRSAHARFAAADEQGLSALRQLESDTAEYDLDSISQAHKLCSDFHQLFAAVSVIEQAIVAIDKDDLTAARKRLDDASELYEQLRKAERSWTTNAFLRWFHRVAETLSEEVGSRGAASSNIELRRSN